MDLVLNESFVAVADAGTISSAADALNISQSALSRRLQHLERDLGVQLLVRRREGVQLTSAGTRALVVSRRLVDQYRQLRHEIGQEADLSSGLVRVGGGATAAMLLPPCIARLHDVYPGLRFSLREAGSRSIADDVAQGRLDLGIVTTPIEDASGVDLEPLLEDEIVLVAPLGQAPSGPPVEPLSQGRLIAFESGSAIRRLIDDALSASGIEVDIVAELRSIPAMLRLVRETGLPAFVSRLSLVDQLDLGPVSIEGLRIVRELSIATRRHIDATPATVAFGQVLRAHAREATASARFRFGDNPSGSPR